MVGNITDLDMVRTSQALNNRLVTTLSSSYLICRRAPPNFPEDFVYEAILTGFYGLLTTQNRGSARGSTTTALSFEDRLSLTRTFSMTEAWRVEHIGLDRNSTDQNGLEKASSRSPNPGRRHGQHRIPPGRPFGLTSSARMPPARIISANNIFLLRADPAAGYPTSRTYETA